MLRTGIEVAQVLPGSLQYSKECSSEGGRELPRYAEKTKILIFRNVGGGEGPQ